MKIYYGYNFHNSRVYGFGSLQKAIEDFFVSIYLFENITFFSHLKDKTIVRVLIDENDFEKFKKKLEKERSRLIKEIVVDKAK